MNRRDFVISSSALGSFLSLNNVGFSTEFDKDNRAVIFLFLNGGATHIETFNPIPTAASDRRSVTGYVNTNVSGMKFGGLFKNLAKKADKISTYHAFGHRDANHASAQHWLMTGEANFGAGTQQKWPSYGSVASAVYGASNPTNGLPTYTKVNKLQHDGSAWIGAKHTGYEATGKDLKLLVNEGRFQKRLMLKDIFDTKYNKENGNSVSRSWNQLSDQAVDVILGDASKAFKIQSDKDYSLFEKSTLGKNMLQAVRLVEFGSKFVTLGYGGWDMHNNISNGLNGRQSELDNYLSLLIDALERRNLYDKVLLVVSSEFGRTPKVNVNGGRDHWAKLAPLMLSGGGYEMGRVIGKSDKNAEEGVEGLCGPEDLSWTVLDHLGIDKKLRMTANDGRPHYLVKEGSKNILLDI